MIHSCVVDALEYPRDESEFFYPPGRSPRYTILEFSMFEGRSETAKKGLIRLLFERFDAELGISPMDLEITIFEIPKANWGFRGQPGDEHILDYKVEV